MKYFTTTNIDEAKIEYKKLVLQYHPDRNVNNKEYCTKIMIEIMEEWDSIKKGLNDDVDIEIDISEFKDIIDKTIGLDGVIIEVCGCWIWVSGNTYLHKDIFKSAGFLWSGKKKMWYYRKEEEGKKVYKKSTDMETIRNLYGSTKVDATVKYLGSK